MNTSIGYLAATFANSSTRPTALLGNENPRCKIVVLQFVVAEAIKYKKIIPSCARAMYGTNYSLGYLLRQRQQPAAGSNHYIGTLKKRAP
jgi:hypothetical protein